MSLDEILLMVGLYFIDRHADLNVNIPRSLNEW